MNTPTPPQITKNSKGYHIGFAPQNLWGFVDVETFELESEHPSSSQSVRHSLSYLNQLRLKIQIQDLEKLIFNRIKNHLFREFHLKTHDQLLLCWGIYTPSRGRPTPFYLEGGFYPSTQGIRFEFYQGYLLGNAMITVAQLVAILFKEAQLPALPNHPTALHFDVLTEVSLAFCLDWGWKLPQRNSTGKLFFSSDAIHYHIEDRQDHPFTPQTIQTEHLERLKQFHEGENYLHQGEYESALRFYRSYADHPFAQQRKLELGLSNQHLRDRVYEWIKSHHASLPSPLLFSSYYYEYQNQFLRAAQRLQDWKKSQVIFQELTDSSTSEAERVEHLSSHSVRVADPHLLSTLIDLSRAFLLWEGKEKQGTLTLLEKLRNQLPPSPYLLDIISQLALSLGNSILAQSRLSEQAQIYQVQEQFSQAAWVWVKLGELWRKQE